MNREEYINSAVMKIEDKAARTEVKKELEAHIDDRILYYTEAGYSEDYALEKTLTQMGDCTALGEKMGRLHGSGKLSRLSRLLSVIFAAGLTVSSAAEILLFLFDEDIPYDTVNALFALTLVIIITACQCGAIAFFLAHKSGDDYTLSVNGAASIIVAVLGIYSLFIYAGDISEFFDLSDYYFKRRIIMAVIEAMILTAAVYDFIMVKKKTITAVQKRRYLIVPTIYLILTSIVTIGDLYCAAIIVYDNYIFFKLHY